MSTVDNRVRHARLHARAGAPHARSRRFSTLLYALPMLHTGLVLAVAYCTMTWDLLSAVDLPHGVFCAAIAYRYSYVTTLVQRRLVYSSWRRFVVTGCPCVRPAATHTVCA